MDISLSEQRHRRFARYALIRRATLRFMRKTIKNDCNDCGDSGNDLDRLRREEC